MRHFPAITLDFTFPKVMAILNLTPDSFFQASRANNIQMCIEKCGQFLENGAEIIDLGAYSTRPGSIEVTESQELDRLLPFLEALTNSFPDAIFSIDTFRSKVAELAIKTGAKIINDISAGELDPNLPNIIAKYQIPYIIMHMRGTPHTMQNYCEYDDLIGDIKKYFTTKINHFKNLGINHLIIDPGFGFSKDVDQNYRLLQNLKEFNSFGFPLLVGISRKSMISKFLNISTENTLNGTTVLNTIALLNGASILRVHDPIEALQTIRIVQKLNYISQPN